MPNLLDTSWSRLDGGTWDGDTYFLSSPYDGLYIVGIMPQPGDFVALTVEADWDPSGSEAWLTLGNLNNRFEFVDAQAFQLSPGTNVIVFEYTDWWANLSSGFGLVTSDGPASGMIVYNPPPDLVSSWTIGGDPGPGPDPDPDPDPDPPDLGKRIIFDAVQGGDTTTELPPSSGTGRVPVLGFGYADTITALGAVGLASIPISQGRSQGSEVGLPSFGDGYGLISLSQAYSYGGVAVWPALGDAVLRIEGFGFEAADVGFGVLPFYGFGESFTEDDELPPPIWQDGTVFVGELIDMAGSVSIDALHLGVARDAASLAVARTNHRLRAAAAAREALRMGDEIALVFQVLVEEGVQLQGQVLADHTAVARAVERLVLTGVARGYSEAAALVTDGIVFEALVDMLASEQVVDAAVLGSVVADLHTAVGRAVATALLDVQAAPSHTGVVVLSDTVLASSAVRSEAELRAALRESIGFSARLHLDNDEYIAWVLNTESTGLSRYTNYPFNSFARIGDRYYGLTSGGLYRLDGDTDDGEPISAKISTGMFDFGDRVLKGIPEAYVGYASDGTMLLRTVFVHPKTGEKAAADYRLVPRGAAATRENRFEGGRGVFSVDWSFELENVGGADFELESIEFRPVALSRRVRG